jgi:hypothetical protein
MKVIDLICNVLQSNELDKSNKDKINTDKQIKGLFIFDFDQTLSNTHLFRYYKNDIDKFINDYNDKQYIFQSKCFNTFDITKNIFEKIINEGYQICIASFGYQNMLEKFIEYSYGYNLISKDNIAGSSGYNDKWQDLTKNGWASTSINCITNKRKHCKNGMINYFINKYNIKSNNIIFFDDDIENCEQAIEKWNDMIVINNGPSQLSGQHIENAFKFSKKEINTIDGYQKENNIWKYIQDGGFNKYIKYKNKYQFEYLV